jgi:uncharacterized protein (DUF885 family)
MMSKTGLLFSFALAACLAACSRQDAPPPETTAAQESALRSEAQAPAATADVATQLSEIVAEYFEEFLELNPVFATVIGDNRYNDRWPNNIGPEYRDAMRGLEERYLARVEALDAAALAGNDLLTYEIFRSQRRQTLEGMRFPAHLVPVNQFFGAPNFFAVLGSGAGVQPFVSVGDYDNFLGRVDGFVVWIEQAIANMNEGREKGIVQPKVIMERVLPQLAAQLVEDPEQSLFYGPIQRMPAEIAGADRERLTAAYKDAITAKIVPSYRKLHDYIRDVYLPDCRDTVGWTALPGGREWYDYLVRQTTTTDLSAEEIHDIGLAEVARIRAEMETVKERVGFEGTLNEFFESLKADPQFYFDEPEQLLTAYRSLKERVAAAVPQLFSLLPQADLEIREVEAFRQQSAAAASYMPSSPDGSRPGVFYVNTYDLPSRPRYAIEAIYLHEAAPGHHFQIALAQELEGLPQFRRFGRYTAYVEGWGLYAESLGPELGMYEDPYNYYGALTAEMWRAIRLVVDSGMHAKGWSRDQALAFMRDNSSIGEADVIAEIDRYIAVPSQALAYKIGQLKIRELRTRAEKALGDGFEIRGFHAQVLEGGALPLDVLEAKIDRWIASQQ